MKILILTSIYKGTDIPLEFTQVVHYFAKQWNIQGHEVFVVHNLAYYNKFFYFLSFFFKRLIESLTGTNVPLKRLSLDKDYEIDNIQVSRMPIYKVIPYAKFSNSSINKQYQKIINKLSQNNFIPDLIIGHWGNPQLNLIKLLKSNFINSRAVVTLHSDWKKQKKIYGDSFYEHIGHLDKLGFRNKTNMSNFLEENNTRIETFICYSGLPNYFFTEDDLQIKPSFNEFIFIGTMIKRKYPYVVLNALTKAFKNNFKITYIGNGFLLSKIKRKARNLQLDSVKFYSKLGRSKIKSELNKADCLIMISEKEAFGLVYIEAMSRGCIVISSKNEGMDGIIIDGYNGFLCNPGDEDQLADILVHISKLSANQIVSIKKNAIKSAKNFTEEKVSKDYIDSIIN